MKQKHQLPFLFDMRGFFPEERVDGGLWPQQKWLYRQVFRFFKKKESAFLTHANHIISLTHRGKEVLLQRNELKNQADKISVIPCCTDLSHFDPEQVSNADCLEKRKQFNISADALVGTYVGSLGTWYLVEDMVRWVAQLRKKHAHFVWLVITRDSPHTLLELLKKHEVPEDALRLYAAQRAELPTLLKLCNFSFFFIQPSFSKQASSPTKQGEIMAMGLPVVCNAGVGDSDWLVEKYQAGWVCPNLSDATLEAFATRIPDLLTLSADEIRSGAAAYFSLTIGVQAYASVYAQMTQSNRKLGLG